MPRKRSVGGAADESPKGKRGEGSTYEYPKGSNNWFFEVPIEGQKPHRQRATGATNRKEADAQRAAFVEELREKQRQGIDFSGSRLTLGEFVNAAWWPSCLGRDLAPKTLRDYEKTVQGHLLPDWGDVRLDRFNVDLIITIRRTIAKNATHPVAHNAIAKLSMILEAAHRRHYVLFNAVADARRELPKIDRKTPPVLTDGQLHQLLQEVEGTRLAALWHLEIFAGMRIAELLGLQRNDIDWKLGIISVRRQVQEVGSVVSIRNKTKTKAGMRKVPVPPRVLSRLRDYTLTLGDSIWLFPNDEGGMFRQSNFERYWHGGVTSRYLGADGKIHTKTTKGVRQKANLPSDATMHGFRHTANNRMMLLGVPPEVRQKIYGWGKEGIEQHYTNADLKSMIAAMQLSEQALWSDTADDLRATM